MRLTVLGNYGSFPGKNGACSGYLLEESGTRLLLDCGSGVISRLQRYCDVTDLDAVLVSHLHGDHAGDLMVLRYGLESRKAFGEPISSLPLYLPASPVGWWEEFGVGTAFNIRHIHPGLEVSIHELSVRFARMPHSIESYAMIITGKGKKLVYSGDTTFSPALVEAARSADLLLCEATRAERDIPDLVEIPHLTPRLAGEIAYQAKVKRLLLTHFWYQEDRAIILEQACREFPNSELAKEFVSFEI